MKRQSPPKAAASIALFPFLAVLLCTMGGLIILLVVIARHAKQQAAVDSRSTIAAREDLEVRRSDLQWRKGHLRAARDKTAAELAGRRLEISHLEDHIRRLRDSMSELERAMIAFDHHAADKADDTAKMRARLEDLQQQARATQEEIDKNRKALPKSQSYAVIPYGGPHQTHRRPIYIECREDAIVMQPEGIELKDSDFGGPPGAGNPLAAGLRAAREYLVKNGGGDPADDGEPYPLLLVRPDGILAYYAAREAMSSWGSDFGYEFVDQDWQIEYRPPEAGLAVAVSQAIDDARHRQAALALAAPRMPHSRQRQGHRATRGRNVSGGSSAVLAGSPSGSTAEKIANGAGGDLTPDDMAGLYGPGAGVRSEAPASGNSPPSGNSLASKRPASALLKVNVNQDSPDADAPDADSSGPKLKSPETSGQTFASTSRSSTSGAGDLGGIDSPPTAEEVRTPKRSLAKSRGKDWGLPGGNHHAAVAVTRPIRVRCYGSYLVVMREADERLPSQLISLDYRTQAAIDVLVTTVHQSINSWGAAGRGKYWRPTLVLEVAPNGKARAADLRELLADSGFGVSEKALADEPPDTQRR